MSESGELSRRRLVETVGLGVVVGGAGCLSGSGNETPSCSAQTPPKGDVSKNYRTATSQGGVKRDPNILNPKENASYQVCPNGNARCSGCKYFIPPQGNDDYGVCTRVEGYINPTGWCSLYTPK